MHKSFWITLLVTLFVVGCNKPPTACIEMDQTTVGVGTEVTFTSCSERALSFEWFMEGPEGAPENSMGWSDAVIKHSFSVAGNYTILLNTYNKYSSTGDKASTTATLTVQ